MEVMKRIAVIGSSGAGKSRLSLALSRILNISVIHLDAHYWNPGWTPTPRPNWAARQQKLLEPERWIADGNYSSTLELRLAAADTVIFLDLPRWLCTWRVLKRVVQYRRGTRPDMAAGCDERVDWDFVKYVWTFPEKHRPRVEEKLRGLSGKQVYRLHTTAEVERFLREVSSEHASFESSD